MEEAVATVLVGVLTLVLGTIIILMAMWRRMKFREMHHRERMAMIERGITPGPSMSDPIERILGDGPHGPHLALHDYPTPTVRRSRLLSGGVATIGFGLALMTLIGVASGEPNVALGIGGAIVIIGFSFVVIALVQGGPKQSSPSAPPPSTPPSSPLPPDREN